MAIAAESLVQGARTSEIALPQGLYRIQFHDWRRQFRSSAVADADFAASDFVPVVAENQTGSSTTAIEIEIGGASLRVVVGLSSTFLRRFSPLPLVEIPDRPAYSAAAV